LIAPKTAQVWAFATVPISDDAGSPGVDWDERQNVKTKLLPKSQMDLSNLEKYANLQLQVRRDGQVEFNGRTVSKKVARHSLLQAAHLDKTAADQLLAQPGQYRLIVSRPGQEPTLDFAKLAAPYHVPAINFPETQDGYASESGQYMIEDRERQNESAEPLESMRPELQPHEDVPGQIPGTPGFGGGGSGYGDNNGVNADTITENEVDSLFDVSGLLSVIRNSRIDTQIKRTTQALLKSIDELGTALFIFYAHNEEFEAMYGEDAMDDLESAMISHFEGGGDLFITLTRRSADPHPELDISDLPQQ
jgi:hypothetical protein